MNAFSPLITHSPVASSSTALVRVPPASLPASGSVRPKPPRARPAQQVGQPALALLLGAELEDRVGAEADPGLEGDGHRLVDPAELLDGDAQRGEVGAAAAVLLGERQAEQARARPWPAPCRPGTCGRGPRPRRAARSRPAAKSRTTLRNASCSAVRSKSIGPDRTLAPWPTPRWVLAIAARGRRRSSGHRPASTSPPTSPRSTATGFWAVVLPFAGPPVCARFADVRPARPWPGRPWVGPDPSSWTQQPRSTGVRGRRRDDPRRHRRRRRVPGQPHPPAVAPRCRPTPTIAALGAALAERQPGAVQRGRAPAATTASRSRRRRPSGSSPVAAAACGRRPSRARPRRRRRLPAQGPGRERDDRRPRAQRPRAGCASSGSVHVPVAARGRAPPRARPPGQHRRGPAAGRRRLGRAARRHVPARLGDRRPQARRPRPHRPARAGRARRLLRGRRLGRRRPPAGRAQRRHPHVLGRGRPAALRHRRRHHLGLDAGRRVGRDRAEGAPPAAASRPVSPRV